MSFAGSAFDVNILSLILSAGVTWIVLLVPLCKSRSDLSDNPDLNDLEFVPYDDASPESFENGVLGCDSLCATNGVADLVKICLGCSCNSWIGGSSLSFLSFWLSCLSLW